MKTETISTMNTETINTDIAPLGAFHGVYDVNVRETSVGRLMRIKDKFRLVGIDLHEFIVEGEPQARQGDGHVVGPLDREALYDALMTTDAGNMRAIFGSSVKTEKGKKVGVATIVLYMAASIMSGLNLCPWASKGCAKACLGHTTGRLKMSSAQKAQLCKALAWHVSKRCFLRQMDREIRAHVRKSEREGYIPAVRGNGSTDILWERYGVPQRHPKAEFYDYTKAPHRARRAVDSIPNYHLTFSVSERDRSEDEALKYLRAGGNAALVVAGARTEGKRLLRDAKDVANILSSISYRGFPTIDGDETDVRFDDPPGHWVVLHAKGKQALGDETGFVRRFGTSSFRAH